MIKKVRKLVDRRVMACISLILLIVFTMVTANIFLPKSNNINVGSVVSKLKLVGADVTGASSEMLSSSSYDEVVYQIDVDKDSLDEAIITGTLTDEENKYARFKDTSLGNVSPDGKTIEIKTKSKKVKITLAIVNAPYGETFNPKFKINSSDTTKQNINTTPVKVETRSIEGRVLTEDGNSIESAELSLNKDSEIKRTYSDSEGKYVFSLPDSDNYIVKLEEEKYKVVRLEDITTNENKKILNIIVKEVKPFNVEINKTISKLDLILDGNKETFEYNDESRVIKNIKKANSIEGSIYYKISLTNTGEINGSLTLIKDIIHDGLSFNEEKNPGWELRDGELYYTVLEGTDIGAGDTKDVTLVLDIIKTNEAKTYLNEAIGNANSYKNVVYILNNNIYREEYVIEGEKIKNIDPGVDGFNGWYTDKNYTNKYSFKNEVTKNLILYGKINDNKYTVTFIDRNPNTLDETIIDTVIVNEGDKVNLPSEEFNHKGYTFKCFEKYDECFEDEEIRENTTLYTKYKINNYNIAYELNNGELEKENPNSYTIKDEIKLNNPSKLGYTFIGWIGTDLTDVTKNVIISKGSTGDRVYKAIYEINKSTLTINPNGGRYEDSSEIVSVTNDYGTILTIKPSEKEGYTFKKYVKTGGGIYNENLFTFDSEDATLTANYEINEYIISYEGLSDKEIENLNNPTSYTIETNTFTLSNPERKGYTFIGWTGSDIDDKEISVSIEKGSIGNRTYKANFKEIEYTINYDLKNGTLEDKTNPNIYTIKTDDFTLNNPKKEGYKFLGWSGTDLTEIAKDVTVIKGSTGNRSYTANYETINYKITYENITDEEKNLLNNPVNYNIESETFILNNPNTRVDSSGLNKEDFLGWDDGNGNVSINITIEKGSIGDRTYKAVWKENEDDYSIVYNLNGGSLENGKINPNTYQRGTKTFTLNNPSKEGYNFIGWTGTGLDELTKTVTIEKGSSGNRSYTANYEAIIYTISYEGLSDDEKSLLNNPTSYTIETNTFTLNNPSRKGYEFIGWSGSDITDKELTVSVIHGSIGNKTFKANFKPIEYSIKYNLNNGTLDKSNKEKYTIETEEFKLNNPSKEGYNFLGWSGSNLSEITKDVSVLKGTTGNLEYTANYEPIVYTITYEGLDEIEIENLNNPTSYTIESKRITLSNPERKGYTFQGWSGTDIDNKKTTVSILTGSIGNRVYQANFEENEYTISYKLNGGSLEDGRSNPERYTVETNTFKLNNPNKEGYKFLGWSGSNLSEITKDVSVLKGTTGNLEYTANYEPIVYKITYDYNVGSLGDGKTNPVTYTIESETITFNNPSKEGYTFKNYKENNLIVTEIPKGSTGDRNLSASYEINKFTVNFYNDEELFSSKIVSYKEKVSESNIPLKAHSAFKYWSKDKETEFDFNTLITEDTNLYAVFDEVLAPVIIITPELNTLTNKTWVCDDASNEECGVLVTINKTKEEYEVYYSVGDSEYTLYTEPFKVYDNKTVNAFNKYNGSNSINTEKTVTNVDKINPIIEEESIKVTPAAFSLTLRGNTKDNESGIRKYELYILDENEILENQEPYTTIDGFEGNHDDANIEFKFTNLINNTTYDLYIKAFDYVGNSEIYKVSATTTDYVARIVGRSNLLYEDESMWEKFESVQDAIDACEDIQCTIQINPDVVNESTEVNESQNVTFDLDGKTLTSTNAYTILVHENAKLTLIDNSESKTGNLSNTVETAIINNGIFTLGKGYPDKTEEKIVPEEYPVVTGNKIGLDNNGLFNFYDGYLISTALDDSNPYRENDGAEAITQYPYNVNITSDAANNKKVASLEEIAEPEARIKSVYYTKLNTTTGLNAVDSANNGKYENKEVSLLSTIRQDTTYGFIYNKNEDSIISSPLPGPGANAMTELSYVKVDLTDYDEDQILLLNAESDIMNTNNYGFISLSEKYGDYSNRLFTLTGLNASKNRILTLHKGKVYYIYFGYYKYKDTPYNEHEYFKVNSMKLVKDAKVSDYELLHHRDYYMQLDENGNYYNNNRDLDKYGTISDSYMIFDMMEESEPINVILNVDVNSAGAAWRGYGFIVNTDSEELPNLDANEVIKFYQLVRKDNPILVTLEPGRINYVHIGFNHTTGYVDQSYEIILNDITFQRPVGEDIKTSNLSQNDNGYYFSYYDYDYRYWKNLANGDNATVNSVIFEEDAGGKFNGYNSFVNLGQHNYDEFTWETTFETKNPATTQTVMANYENGGLGINVKSSKIELEIHIDGGYRYVRTGYNITANTKYKVNVTYKEGLAKLYVNDAYIGSYKGTKFGLPTSNTVVMLGANPGGSSPQGQYFNGNIYDAKIYNIAFTDEQVEENYMNSENLVSHLDSNNHKIPNDSSILKSNNTGVSVSTAHSYISYDLSDSDTNKYLTINYTIDCEIGNNDYGYIYVTDTPDLPNINSSTNRYLLADGNYQNQNIIITLQKNKMNYVHFIYYKNKWTDVGLDSFIINSIKMNDTYTEAELSSIKTISLDNLDNNKLILPMAKLNEEPSRVVMLKDIIVNNVIDIPEEKEIVLDLNGHNLSTSISDYVIVNDGNLTIVDGKYEANSETNKEQTNTLKLAYNELYNNTLQKYHDDTNEYLEYSGLCEGCSPSDEYIIDNNLSHISDYTGEEDVYEVPATGIYEIELWGASGGGVSYNNRDYSGGAGGYSIAHAKLNKGDKLYINVGEEGSSCTNRNCHVAGGYNGGSDGIGYNVCESIVRTGSGGGATSVALSSGVLADLVNNKDDVLMVAGGGGAGNYCNSYNYGQGGSGGGASGEGAINLGAKDFSQNGGAAAIGGSQFENKLHDYSGIFGSAVLYDSTNAVGAGGGYYGGTSSGINGAGGGSGYIGSPLLSNGKMIIYSTNTNLIDDQNESTYTEITQNISNEPISNYGKRGNGYAKITLISEETIEELKNSLDKTYKIKEKPMLSEYFIDSGIDYTSMKINNSVNLSTTRNFSYKASNLTSSFISTNNGNLVTQTSYLGNKSSTYYNDIIKKEEVVQGSFRGNTNNDSLTGKVYVGLAKTSEININDYYIFEEYNINNTTQSFDFSFVNDYEDAYFKIIMIHGSQVTGNSIYTALTKFNVSNLSCENIDFGDTNLEMVDGSITSTSANVIMNKETGKLNIEAGTINASKDSIVGIINRGDLTLGNKAIINVNNKNSTGVRIETDGVFTSEGGTINVNGESSVGLTNMGLDNLIENLNINTAISSDSAIRNEALADITFNNLNINGNGIAFNEYSNANLTINNSILNSNSNESFYSFKDPRQYLITINNSYLNNRILSNGSSKDYVINNSKLVSTRGNIYSDLSDFEINDSILESSSNNIANYGVMVINNSTISGNDKLVENSHYNHYRNAYLELNGCELNLNTTSNVVAINNEDTLELIDTNINTVGSSATAIANTDYGYVSISGDSTISSNFATAINNNGNLRLGNEKSSYAYNDTYNFHYTGSVQEFVVPKSGNYKVEAWGAQGASRGYENYEFKGGKGAYTSGDIYLTEGEKLYIYVGAHGSAGKTFGGNGSDNKMLASTSYNGSNMYSGGSTDISLDNEENHLYKTSNSHMSIRSEASYLQRIMVAAGGGMVVANQNNLNYSAANTLSDPNSVVTQTSGYAFGYGELTDGGGAGYFGGTNNIGGSSYISGYLGSVAMNGSSTNPKCSNEEALNDITCSYHTSGKIFTNTVMMAGREEMPTHSSSGLMLGNDGNGYARITYLDGDNTSVVSSKPSINASGTAITGLGRFDYFDGTITGATAINEDIRKTPDNYDINYDKSGSKQVITLKSYSEEPYVCRIGDTNYTSLELAINACNENDEIVLLTDIDEAKVFTIDKKVTIDYNGFRINSYNSDYLFINNGDLTIKDNDKSSGNSLIYGKGYIKNNGKLTTEYLKLYGTLHAEYMVYNTGEANLSELEINREYYRTTTVDYTPFFMFNAENATTIVTDSNFIVNCEGHSTTKFIDNYGDLTIKDTIFNNYNNATNSATIINYGAGELTLDNVTTKTDNKDGTSSRFITNYGIANINNSNLNNTYLNNYSGTMSFNNTKYNSGSLYSAETGLLIINSGNYANGFSIASNGHTIDNTEKLYSFILNGGTISSTVNISGSAITDIREGYIMTRSDYAINNSGAGIINIGVDDGIVSDVDNANPIISSNSVAINTSNSNAILNFYDGLITASKAYNVTVENIAEGYIIHRDYNSEADVEARYLLHEAMFKNVTQSTTSNEVLYYSIGDLNNALSNGLVNNNDTIKLINDITVLKNENSIIIPEGLAIIFDLNNHLIDKNNDTLFINNGTLTLIDEKDTDGWNNTLSDTISKMESNEIVYDEFEFDYTGEEEEFTIPVTGTYKIEVWGAQGGNNTSTSGLGGYSTGKIELNKNDKLYINVGGTGGKTNPGVSMHVNGGYNGGGYTNGQSCCSRTYGSGGGATSIATTSGLLSTLENDINSIIIVAAGGGGGFNGTGGGNAGGYIGSTGTTTNNYGPGVGGTQTSGGINPKTTLASGSFGHGGEGSDNGGLSTGGGSGLYGGSGSEHIDAAGGGSGYIGNENLTSKTMYCYNCQATGDTNIKTISNRCTSSTATKNCSKSGNGYVRIVLLSSTDTYDYTDKDINDLAIKYLNSKGKSDPKELTDGKIESKNGKVIENNNELFINSGNYEGEQYSVDSTVIKNNANLTINGGTFTKYYDNLGFTQKMSGSILENNGYAEINDGNFYANGSYVIAHWGYIFDGNNYYDDNFIMTSVIYKNNDIGTLMVNGGYYSGIESNVWNDNNRVYESYKSPNKGTLITNSGDAIINDIVSDNSHIGTNSGTLIFNNVRMEKIININTQNYPNLINNGNIIFNNSNFITQASFVNNNGNIEFNDVTLTRTSNGTNFRTEEDANHSIYQNSFIIKNIANNNNHIDINNSEIKSIGGSSMGIYNKSNMNINNSVIESIGNTSINNTNNLTIYNNSKILSSKGIGISNTGTLNLGISAISDNITSKEYPLIEGTSYGISTSGIFNFYDGYIKGKSKAINGTISSIENGYTVITPSDAIDSYYVAYLDKVPVILNVMTNEKYLSLNEALENVSDNETLKLIDNYNVLNTDETAIVNKKITLDLNGYTIGQGNDTLIRNNSKLTITDTSSEKTGNILMTNGTKCIDNFGELIINGGTIKTSGGKYIVYNNALTEDEINNNIPKHSLLIQNDAKLIATDRSIIIINKGLMNVYNGAYLKNQDCGTSYLIDNYGELNIIDLNIDDNPNTSSEYSAPIVYSTGNYVAETTLHHYYTAAIKNELNAELLIIGGVYNNGGTLSNGVTPDMTKIVANYGTATIKNLDNYSSFIGNNWGTLYIEDCNIYNLEAYGLHIFDGTTSIKNTLIEITQNRVSMYGKSRIILYNTTLDNVTIRNRNNSKFNEKILQFNGKNTIINSNIDSSGESMMFENLGTLDIKKSDLYSNQSISNSGTLNIYDANLSATTNVIHNNSIINVYENAKIISSNAAGIYNTSSGTVNLGTNDGVVNLTSPLIEGATFGIDNTEKGRINFYDGLLKGLSGPTALGGPLTNAEGGYILTSTNKDESDDGKYQTTLKENINAKAIIAKVGRINFSSQDEPYVTATDALINAIEFAISSNSSIDLLQPVTLERSINASSSVRVYKNGNDVTIPEGITVTNVSFVEGQSGASSSLERFAANVFNVSDNENDIVITETDDGLVLDTTRTYNLYLDDSLVKLKEVEAGTYSYRGKVSDLKPIKGRIYINNLLSGKYKLVSDNGKEVNFNIDEEGNITGNVRKYEENSNSRFISTSLAELIISIQTGITRYFYILIIIPIVIILFILLYIRRKQKQVS